MEQENIDITQDIGVKIEHGIQHLTGTQLRGIFFLFPFTI